MSRPFLALALGLVAISSCRCKETALVPHCPIGSVCYVRHNGETVVDPQDFIVSGECRFGVVAGCDADLNAICVGSVGPTPELCNRLDDDCDGGVDEDTDRRYTDPANDCRSAATCMFPTQYCEAGLWFCRYPFGVDEEVCNGNDDDCDGEVDEGLDAEEFFYPSDVYPDTVGLGPCRPGVRTCSGGRAREAPPITPVTEILCNDIDDNCDGIVDEDESGPARAFVILFDRSGSMDDKRAMLEAAICSWSTNSLSANTTFAVVYFGLGFETSEYVTVAQDFGTAEQTCGTLFVPFAGGSYGPEYALEAMSIGNQLEWPVDADRYQLVFTDESIQQPAFTNITRQQIEADCAAAPYEIGVFTRPDLAFEWGVVVSSCGGFVEPFAPTAGEMEAILHQRFVGNDCGP